MSTARFIQRNFIGKELCIYLNQSVETISYEQADSDNKEYFRGVVVDIDDPNDYHPVLTMDIKKAGRVYINVSRIVSFWEPDKFEYYKGVSASITRRPVGRRFGDA